MRFRSGTTALLPFLLLACPVFAEVSIENLIEDAGLDEGTVAMRDFPGWRAPRKLVITEFAGLTAELRAEFPDLDIVGADSDAEARAEVADADALIGFCSDEVLEAGDRLVWVQIFSAGAERCVPVERVAGGDVVLTNMQKMSSPVLGEHAVAMMLALARGIVQYSKRMPSGEWNRGWVDDFGVMSVNGKTMLVAGLGGIGTAAAKRASGLGMRVIATRASSREGPDFVDYVGLSDELFELAAQADVVVNALPLTPETEDLFDAAFFDAAKRGHYFINVGRGGSVVTADLVAALNDGHVAGAGLDVTDPEPLPADHVLWQMDNVVITPHMAGFGSDRERHAALLKDNIRRFIAGEPLLNVVDPEKGY